MLACRTSLANSNATSESRPRPIPNGCGTCMRRPSEMPAEFSERVSAMQWYEIMPFDDLWIGEMLGVEVGGVKVLLINVEDEVQAYLYRCPHPSSPLSAGNFEALTLPCATHLAAFIPF